MMYSSETFLNVQKARSCLVPKIKNYLIPLILLELFLSMIYQIPLQIFEPGEYSALDKIVKILGIEKYLMNVKNKDGTGF